MYLKPTEYFFMIYPFNHIFLYALEIHKNDIIYNSITLELSTTSLIYFPINEKLVVYRYWVVLG